MIRWVKQYILLVLRIGKAIQSQTQDVLYDLYGQPQLEAQVANENVWSAEELMRETSSLMNSLPIQGFDTRREVYLSKILAALETTCRRLTGIKLSLREEALRYFDIDIEWIPESIFEEALTLYEKALPGKGSIRERLINYNNHYELMKDKAYLLPELIQYTVKETCKRTSYIMELPSGAKAKIQPITDKPVKAMAQYLGNYNSTIFINTSIPFNISELLSIVSHEGYPGHIAEFILKEEYLVKRKGYIEQQVGFLLTPPYVISEGIALMALKNTFAPGEAEQWMADHIYPKLGIEGDSTDLLTVQKAKDLLRGVLCNAAFLMEEGRPINEVINYVMKYTLCSEEQAYYSIKVLQRPFCESYIFTYYHGRILLESALYGPNSNINLKRLLTEQITISDL